jgi:hypothetical protein
MKNRIFEILESKAQKLLVLTILLVFSFSSCTRNIYVTKKLPPGQAKKATGSQSAKPYAPGQMKKHK